MKPSVEGIMYPIMAKALVLSRLSELSEHRFSSHPIEVPHAAWSRCKEELDSAFSFGACPDVNQVFVLGPLHKGPVGPSDEPMVYAPADGELCGSDWKISLGVPARLRELVASSDDICSEEQSLEIIAPYLSVLFPNAQVCYLLASGRSDLIGRIVEKIGKDFPFSPIFISNNKETNCAAMWKEAFGI